MLNTAVEKEAHTVSINLRLNTRVNHKSSFKMNTTVMRTVSINNLDNFRQSRMVNGNFSLISYLSLPQP